MPKIYLVRHGQTDWNAAARLQGQEDIPLNDTGRGQAMRNGGILKATLSDSNAVDFVASPLSRTRETMEIVRGEMALPVTGYRMDEDLKEIHFGDWQGYTWDQLRESHPDKVEAREQNSWAAVVPGKGAESYSMLSTRALKWFSGIRNDTVAVTHCGVIRCILGHINRLPHQEIPHIEILQDRVYMIDASGITPL